MILQEIMEKVGFLNTHAGTQQNENVNLKSKGCCVAVGDGFMPVALQADWRLSVQYGERWFGKGQPSN